MKITKEQLSKKIHECHMDWANNTQALAKKHGLNGDAQYEFIELVSKIIDHAWAETRYGVYSHHDKHMEDHYYEKYLPIYGPMIEAELEDPEDKDPDDMDEDEYIDYISDQANKAHERSEGMER